MIRSTTRDGRFIVSPFIQKLSLSQPGLASLFRSWLLQILEDPATDPSHLPLSPLQVSTEGLPLVPRLGRSPGSQAAKLPCPIHQPADPRSRTPPRKPLHRLGCHCLHRRHHRREEVRRLDHACLLIWQEIQHLSGPRTIDPAFDNSRRVWSVMCAEGDFALADLGCEKSFGLKGRWPSGKRRSEGEKTERVRCDRGRFAISCSPRLARRRFVAN